MHLFGKLLWWLALAASTFAAIGIGIWDILSHSMYLDTTCVFCSVSSTDTDSTDLDSTDHGGLQIHMTIVIGRD
jgi:hypothetical protein